jgi:hypothetical protein
MRRLACLPVLALAFTAHAAEPQTLLPYKAPAKKGWGFLGADGKVAIPPGGWQRVMPFSEGLAAVKRDGFWGYIDTAGKEVVIASFVFAGDFHDGLAPVERREGQFAGWIDRTGNVVLEAGKLGVVKGDEFASGRAMATAQNRLIGWLDTRGSWVIKPQFYTATRFSEDRAFVTTQDGKAGFIDTSGKLVFATPPNLDVGVFSEGLAYVQQADGAHTYVKPDGSVAFTVGDAGDKPAFGPFEEGKAAFRSGGKWGFLDTSGAVVIPPTYTSVLPFSEGVAAVWNDRNKVGLVDATGKWVVKPRWLDAQPAQGGLLRVQDGKTSWIYINPKGKKLAKAE